MGRAGAELDGGAAAPGVLVVGEVGEDGEADLVYHYFSSSLLLHLYNCKLLHLYW